MIEKVNIYHKDKICDYVANAAQYYYTKQDINSITSFDVTFTSGSYNIVGQVSSSISESDDTNLRLYVASKLDILHNTVLENNFQISNISTNISEFASSSLYYYHNNLSNDNSVAVGYACNNSYTYLPFDVYIANYISNITKNDYKVSKTIVTLINETTMSVDITLPSGSQSENQILQFINGIQQSTNLTTGSLSIQYDLFEDEEDGTTNGMSGMKLAGDLYGSVASVSSGPLCGRDMKQIDKVGTLYARKLAIDELKKNSASEVFIKMIFKKGQEQPIMVVSTINGIDTILEEDFSISKMNSELHITSLDFCDFMIRGRNNGTFVQ